jgi:SAM-dependent methyltransferase
MGTRRLQSLVSAMVEEIAVALVPVERRTALTLAIYARRSVWAPGGSTFEQGLRQWESEAIAQESFPKTGRVLIGGAGAGREARELIQRGYDVIAFDPCSALVHQGNETLGPQGVEIVEASYDDLSLAAQGRGPLAAVLARAPFEAVVLGWASFSHVLSFQKRLELLQTLRALAPNAPILLSYLTWGPRPTSGPRRLLRRFLSIVSRRSPSPIEDRFLPLTGFYRATTGAELEKLATVAGYAIAWRPPGQTHALLQPDGGQRRHSQGAPDPG